MCVYIYSSVMLLWVPYISAAVERHLPPVIHLSSLPQVTAPTVIFEPVLVTRITIHEIF